MAIGDVTERYRLRAVNERDGIESRQRGFKVEGYTVDQAKGAAGIPQYLDPHPDFPDMLVRSIGTAPEGDGAIVTVNYSPSAYAGGSVPPVNQFAEGFIGVDSTFEDVTVDIPLFERVEHVFDEAGAAISKQVFQRVPDVVPFQYSRVVYRIPLAITTINIAGSFGTAMGVAQLIGSQINKVHTIFGRKLLFKPEGLAQRGEGEFKVTYRWIDDPGVINRIGEIPSPSAGPNLRFFPDSTEIYPFFDSTNILPPFKGLRISGNEDPEQPPSVTFFDKYQEEPLGWQTLPGLV